HDDVTPAFGEQRIDVRSKDAVTFIEDQASLEVEDRDVADVPLHDSHAAHYRTNVEGIGIYDGAWTFDPSNRRRLTLPSAVTSVPKRGRSMKSWHSWNRPTRGPGRAWRAATSRWGSTAMPTRRSSEPSN